MRAAALLRRWTRRARSFLALDPRDQVATVALLAGAALAELAVRTVRLPRLAHALGIALEDGNDTQVRARASARRLGPEAVDRRAALVDRVYRAWPRHDSCLRRAILLGFYVRRASPLLRIGVARDGESVRAHAWIEVDGRVVGDEAGDYAPLRPPARVAP